MQRNIYCLYIIKICYWFMLVMPIIFLFYKENGLTTRDLFIIQSAYSLTIVLFEIPSGYLADLFGRKSLIVTGCFLGFTGYFLYTVSYGFIGFLVAEIILGIGVSMISGADSALLYDSLMEYGKKEKYIIYEGRMISAGNFAEAIAGIAGGFLASINLRYPYYGQAFIAFLSVPASIALIEPNFRKINKTENISYFLKIIRYAMIENSNLRWNILLSSVIGSATLAMAWFVQPFFLEINIPTRLYGILWTILNFSVGISALYAARFEKYFGQFRTMLILTIAISAGFWLTGLMHSISGLIVILIFYLFRGIATPVLKNYINIITPSEMRATVLSIRSLLIRSLFAAIAPMFGWLADKYSLSTALLSSGIIFFVLGGLSIFMFKYSAVKNRI